MMNNQTQLMTFSYLSQWDPTFEEDKTPGKVVVTAFLQKGNRFLVLQRARKDLQHKLWGIPGGKLDKGELPLQGLLREIKEETQLQLSASSFQLLGTAISSTPSDGQYGLYIYHSFVEEDVEVQINQTEHSEYCWVTLIEFRALELLTAQREAFYLVEEELKKINGMGERNV